jgi:hypothetical protein
MDWGVAYFAFFSIGLVLCGLFLEYRKNKLIHLERMAAIAKGMPPASPDERPLRVYFRRGLLWLIPGIGLTMFLRVGSSDFSTVSSGAGVLMTCIGLAYLFYYFVERRRRGMSQGGIAGPPAPNSIS